MLRNQPPDDNPYHALHPVDDSWKSIFKRALVRIRFYLIVGILLLLAVMGILQYLCYNFSTYGCDPSSLKTYNYPFGDNLLPDNLLLLQEDQLFWKTFMATETDGEGVARRAAVGYFYQVWGPFATTTGFRDSFGHTVFASTQNVFAIGSSKQIYRCDGKDEIYTLSEGSNWFLNRIRNLFGLFTSTEYNIWRGNELVAVSAKVGYSSKNLLIHTAKGTEALAEATLVTRGFHGKYDEWVFHQKLKVNTTLPTFVSATSAALMAFHVGDTPKHAAAGRQRQSGINLASVTLAEQSKKSRPNAQMTPLEPGPEESHKRRKPHGIPESQASDDLTL